MLNHQLDIDKIYLYSEDPYKPKYQLLINKLESVALKHSKNSKASAKYSNDIEGIYESIDECNTNKSSKH